jgi:hypothetical protein
MYPEGDPIGMNKRAKFSLLIFLCGLLIQFLPARSQTKPVEQATRPRTVTPQPTPRQIMPPPVAPVTQSPVTGSLPTQQNDVVVIQPARTLSMNKINARLDEAKRLLKSRPSLTAMTGASTSANTSPGTNASTITSAMPTLSVVTLAVLDEKTSQIHLLTIPKDSFLKKGTVMDLVTSLGLGVRLHIIRANGVNTAVVVYDTTGRSLVPLVVEYPIERGGHLQEMGYYTSAHPALLSAEVVKAGQSYVHTMIDLAAKRLREKGVSIPSNLVDIAERLCVVEHTDHTRFYTENHQLLFEEIYSLYALNQLDTYRFSVSTAGAGGMVQMIPATYQMERRLHPGIGLNPDFVYGMRNHGNALEAMLLYMLDTWQLLAADPDVSAALSSGIATQPELMAAGYNSNPAKLGQYIRRGGASWRTLIPRETQMYLQVYASVESLMFSKDGKARKSL